MKIIFNLMGCGLGDNGGSSTIIKSANTLVDMGHEIIMLDSGKNKHTWTKLKAEHVVNKIPSSADAVIATGFKTVKSTLSLPDSCGIKAHWIRAWEHWQMTEEQMIRKVANAPTLKLVNSICLRDKLKQHGAESHIIRPGYDFDLIKPTDRRKGNERLILGGLYRAGIHGDRKRTTWIFDAVSRLKIRYVIDLWMFGSEVRPRMPIIDKYMRAPTPEQKASFYNKCDIWLAPTMSEGLHLPPAEAMLTKCPVVGTDAELSGMQDYLIDGVTGIVSANEPKQFLGCIDYLIRHKEQREKYGEAARKQILSIGDRKSNMEKLINLFRTHREN